MPWITTKNGKHINTDWFDDDERRKEAQIQANQQEASRMNAQSDRLSADAPVDELRKELSEKLRDADDYTQTDEYKKLVDETSPLFQEMRDIEKRQVELHEIEKKGTVVSKELLEEFGGDRQLARMFAEKTEEAKAAEKEWHELNARHKELQTRYDEASARLKDYESQFVVAQKDKMLRGDSTISQNVQGEYRGFELDTHTPYLQRLQEEGKAFIVEMSPKEYLQRCATDIFDSTYEKQVRVCVADARHTYELADLQASGTKMYMPMLNLDAKEQEGRHRAAAAILNGIERIPVLIVPKRK